MTEQTRSLQSRKAKHAGRSDQQAAGASEPGSAADATGADRIAWPTAAEPTATHKKRLISLRIDADVLEWLKAQGPGYQTRMNNVWRAYAKARTNTPDK